MKSKIYFSIVIFLTVVAVVLLVVYLGQQTPAQTVQLSKIIYPATTSTTPAYSPAAISATTTQSIPDNKNILEKNVFINVPFSSQAPTGNWSDDREENGCEEATSLMAMAWVSGKTSLDPSYAEQEIIGISNYEFRNYGDYHDTSAKDTAERILGGYFGYKNAEVKYNITSDDIKKELQNGNILIIPVNGQKLHNPFYKFPGPIEHMVIIEGYDANTKEFITNDPGTKHGKNYRYSQDVINGAMQDYVTGYHQPITQIVKTVIVIKKPTN